MARAFVYYLADPRSPRHPRYVGMTVNPASRAASHAKPYGGGAELRAWKHSLRAAGVSPSLVVVASFGSEEDALRAEWRCIHRWKRRGFCDCNSGREGAMERWQLWCDGRRRSQASRSAA